MNSDPYGYYRDKKALRDTKGAIAFQKYVIITLRAMLWMVDLRNDYDGD